MLLERFYEYVIKILYSTIKYVLRLAFTNVYSSFFLKIICNFVTVSNITKLNALSEYCSYDKIKFYYTIHYNNVRGKGK